MRKVFYVKKDPAMPISENNWIEMNSFEFEQFIATEEGQKRKDDFGRLDACSENDVIIYLECGAEKAREWKRESNRRAYIQHAKRKRGITIFSYSSMASDEDPEETYSGEQYLEDKDYNLEEIVMKNFDIERMRAALQLLSTEEMELLNALYLNDDPQSTSEYGLKLGMSKVAVFKRKEQILKKLRNLMGVDG